MLAAKVKAVLLRETGKGCGGEICLSPVALEPPYEPVGLQDRSMDLDAASVWILEPPVRREEYLRARLWISPEQSWDWNRCELFLKYLSGLYHRAALEIVGNAEAIHMRWLCGPTRSGRCSATFLDTWHGMYGAWCRSVRLISLNYLWSESTWMHRSRIACSVGCEHVGPTDFSHAAMMSSCRFRRSCRSDARHDSGNTRLGIAIAVGALVLRARQGRMIVSTRRSKTSGPRKKTDRWLRPSGPSHCRFQAMSRELRSVVHFG
jgi:hypothetical protein